MQEWLKQKMDDRLSQEANLNRIRESLQLLALKIMFDQEYFEKLAFVGGTALRILFGLRRFSEDLDFSLVKKRGYDFNRLMRKLEYEFQKNGIEVQIFTKTNTNVHSGLIKFPGLLQPLGLSRLASQKLLIKIEVDSNPPSGWKTVISPITNTFVFVIRHFDLPSLFATKLHACFFRRYAKGRDFYDLIWYLGKKITPNLILLNNAIRQTEKKDWKLNSANWVEFIAKQLAKIDDRALRQDVERFVEDKSELKLLDKGRLLAMVKDYSR